MFSHDSAHNSIVQQPNNSLGEHEGDDQETEKP
jgi:hypothetical protein